MPNYYVNANAQPTGEHEVHKEGCTKPPLPHNKIPLGSHASCQSAVAKAKPMFQKVDGCAYCSPECHTK
jgi:hypothetical protein